MRNLLKPIQNNIDALKFAIEFDIYDLTRDQQDSMLARVQQIQEILDKVNESKV